jgi:RNA polymerase sigma factor (sigma-70 family)
VRRDFGSLFMEWEIGTARRLVREFQRRWSCLREEDLDDLLQECLSHWHFSKNHHNPKREASQRTFMVRVIRNKLTDLVRKKESDKRRIALLSVSLYALAEIDDDFLRGDCGSDKCFTDDAPVNPIEQIDLRIDLGKAMQRLTPRQLELCHLLGDQGYSLREAGDHLHVSRATPREEIRRFRTIFRSENLED